ncbi:MAG: DUF4129 domain-containing protein [Anaerolineales bacterium]|nr:DUF4129 domain-containing protein [Anaerolineales bacterium]
MKANTARVWDWASALLTMLLAYTAAVRLSVTGWAAGLWSVDLLAVLGSLLGLALGFSLFEKAPLRWLMAGYTFLLLPWVWSALISGEASALSRWASLANRFHAALVTAARGEPVTDPLLFVTLMGFLFWNIGLFGGYRVVRHFSATAMLLSAMLPLLVVQYYDSSNSSRIWAVGFFFLLAILLAGRLNFLQNRERWQQKRIFLGEEPVFDLTRGLAIASVLVVLVAWLTPTPAVVVPAAARTWIRINQSLETTRQRLDDLLAALQGRTVTIPGELYENTLPLGRNAQQGDEEIFRVRLSTFPMTRLYWRVRVYDTYAGGQWTSSPGETLLFSPENAPVFDWGVQAAQEIEFFFDWKSRPATLLATPAYPLWVSRAGSVQAIRLPDGTYDLQTWSAAPAIRNGDQYRVRAALSQPTVRQLRAAPQTYPAWVTERYLQLPESASGGVRRLAERLTRDQETAYDKVIVITNYLRSEMEYSLEVPSPPQGVDPVDWFLFTWKSGFCNYYASAQVLLLRAAGIPARLAVGYAPGEYQREERVYRVRARDAHAWPEVYFPGIGWVEFEPTASLSPIYRPAGEGRSEEEDEALMRGPEGRERSLPDLTGMPQQPDSAPDGASSLSDAAKTSSALRFRWVWVIIFAFLAWGAAVGAWQLERRLSLVRKIPRVLERFYLRYHLDTPSWLSNWIRWSEVLPVERAFHAINQALTWLGHPQPPHATPQERAALLKELLPQAADSIDFLTAAHEQTLYAGAPSTSDEIGRVAWAVRYQALRAWFQRRFYQGE